MIANLFLHEEGFKYNNHDTDEDVKSKFLLMTQDMSEIVWSNDNKFFSSNSLSECYVTKDKNFIDFIEVLDYEEKNLLYQILGDTSEEANIPYNELKQKCIYADNESEICAIVAINESPKIFRNENYISFDTYQIVYSHKSWSHLRLQILGNHPENASHFINECQKHLNNLFFHENCINSINNDNCLTTIPRKIVYYLYVLNDCLEKTISKFPSKQINDILEDLSGTYALDKSGSREGTPKKDKLTYKFPDNQGDTIEIYCHPHLKITSPDDNYHGPQLSTFNKRIYFSIEKVKDGKYPIASIGPHI